MRQTRRRYQRGCLRNVNDRWVLKYYDLDGTHRSETLGPSRGPGKITKSDAERLRDERMRPLNEDRRRDRHKTTFDDYVARIYLPSRQDPEAQHARPGTVNAQVQRLKAYILPVIGDVTFEDLEQTDLVSVLKAARARNLGREMLLKLRSDLTQILKHAFGGRYLDHQIWVGLDTVGAQTPAAEKRTISLAEYVTAWNALEERDRLAFDLVMFIGLRQSEAFGLRCGDLVENGIRIRRSWYRGRVEETKTAGSNRTAGCCGELRQRLEAHVAALPAHDANDWVFPSITLMTPEQPNNVMTRRIKPALEPLGLGWLNFAVLRRSCATRNRERGRDLDMLAYQQGHDVTTHLDKYVHPSPTALAAGPEEDYSDFVECRQRKAK